MTGWKTFQRFYNVLYKLQQLQIQEEYLWYSCRIVAWGIGSWQSQTKDFTELITEVQDEISSWKYNFYCEELEISKIFQLKIFDWSYQDWYTKS